MFLIALLFTAIGTAIGSVLEDMQGFQIIMNFLVMPLFFFSNARSFHCKGPLKLFLL
jgi:ABC-2 type transport system permease protein